MADDHLPHQARPGDAVSLEQPLDCDTALDSFNISAGKPADGSAIMTGTKAALVTLSALVPAPSGTAAACQ